LTKDEQARSFSASISKTPASWFNGERQGPDQVGLEPDGLWGGERGERRMLVGALAGLLLLNPLAGMAIGGLMTGSMGVGALSGSFADYGIIDDFIKDLGKTIPKGFLDLDGTALAAIDGLLSRNAISKAPPRSGLSRYRFRPLSESSRKRFEVNDGGFYFQCVMAHHTVPARGRRDLHTRRLQAPALLTHRPLLQLTRYHQDRYSGSLR
jgi:hypothetical protein